MSVLRHWPELCVAIESEQYDFWMSYYRNSGEHIDGPHPPSFNDPGNVAGRKGPYVAFAHSRVKLYKSLLRQIDRLSLKIEYGNRVVEYYENTSMSVGGIVLESGKKREAQVVIAADGINTVSDIITSGAHIEPKETGMAIYRATYPVEHAFSKTAVQERWTHRKGDRPIWEFWVG